MVLIGSKVNKMLYFALPVTVSYVHLASSVPQLAEINQVDPVRVDGIVCVVPGHHNLYILVVVHLMPHLVSVQIQQLVENVRRENIVLLARLCQYHAKQVFVLVILTYLF